MSAAPRPADARPSRRREGRLRSLAYQLAGALVMLLAWQLFASLGLDNPQFREGFAPLTALRELARFVTGPAFLQHLLPSLSRVGIGLAIAASVGVPLGVLVGYFPKVNLVTNAVFQFARMTSPLAWMPLAIIVFGVGSRPVCFLIAVAAVWPIMLNTAHGVSGVDPAWKRVVRMLGADQWGVLRRAVIPAVIPDMLAGLRISIGVSWIVLVPAEMLGVSSGLGYYILDTRDRFNYGELMAVILMIGFLGFVSDALVRAVQRRFSWREASEEG